MYEYIFDSRNKSFSGYLTDVSAETAALLGSIKQIVFVGLVCVHHVFQCYHLPIYFTKAWQVCIAVA